MKNRFVLKAQAVKLGVLVYFLNYSQYFFVSHGFCCRDTRPASTGANSRNEGKTHCSDNPPGSAEVLESTVTAFVHC